MDAVSVVVGVLLILVVGVDVFYTVLFPASGRGPLHKPVERAVWQGFRLLGRPLPRQRRQGLLTYAGPVLIVVTMVVWFGLLLVGWAMVYRPALGGAIQASSGATDVSWWTALYFSGYSLTTLGTGDVVAATGGYRLLSVVEAATGFAVMTMVVTYFLSVYSALPTRNALALQLHHLSLRTDDAAVLVSVLLRDGSDGAQQQLQGVAGTLRELSQTHRAYPVLRRFHYQPTHFALPLVLLTCLEVTTFLRSGLDRDRHGQIARSSAVDQILMAAHVLTEEVLTGDGDTPEPTAEQERAWRRRYREAVATLAGDGVAVRTDAGGEDDYVALRREWDSTLSRLAEQMLHEWSPDVRAAPGAA